MLKSGYTLGSGSCVSMGKRLRICYYSLVTIINWDVSLIKKEIRNSETGHGILRLTLFWGLGLNLVRLVILDTTFKLSELPFHWTTMTGEDY